MKVYLIKASAPGPFKDYKKATGGPPQNIFSVAAATPGGVEIAMCDETVGMKPKMRMDADIVALFFHTPDAPHAYRLADKYRAKGKTVVLGGLHTAFMADEAAEHADALLLGEAEGIWEQLLTDYQAGNLQPRYRREAPVDMMELKPYPTDIIPPSKYDHLWSVVVSRGCPHKCEYCTVPRFFDGKYRLRPVQAVVEEIKAAPADWFELHADNLTANRKYALELFAALKPLGINWYGEATIKMADDDELLKAAAESGCRELLIGIETSSQAALEESNKGFVSPEQVKEKIQKFHDVGIQISSSMIFGFDTHTKEIFKESEEFCRYIGLDEVEGVLLIPFPGTPLYKKLDEQGRLFTKDWSKYDGNNVVFKPAGMSKQDLDEGSYWFWKTIQKNSSIRTTSSSNSWEQREMQTGGGKVDKKEAGVTGKKPLIIKWKALAGLALITVGFIMNWYWVWGILFLAWAIGDIRRRNTHLLEEVHRSETPILYWIIVLIWLICSLLAFSTLPVFADSVNKITGTEMVESTTITGKDFDFSVSFPKTWSVSKEEKDKYSLSYTLEPVKRNGATVYISAVNFTKPVRLADFKQLFDKEIVKDLGFLDFSSSTVPEPEIILDSSISKLPGERQLNQYQGKWEGQPVTALVGYTVKGKYGYCLIGIHGTREKQQAKEVRTILEKFVLTR